MNWQKYNTVGWQGREDYICLNTKAIYIPNYTLLKLLKDIDRVDIWYDGEENAIELRPNPEGIKICRFKKQAHLGTSLARIMPKGWYVWKNGLIFILSKTK